MSRYLPWLLTLVCAACTRVGVKTETATADAPSGLPAEAELVSVYRDPSDANKSTVFRATFGVARLEPQRMEDYRARGKIPFTVSVDFRRKEIEPRAGFGMNAQPQIVRVLREVNSYSIMDGHADIAVLDADGKLVDRQQRDLDLLCPS